MRTTMVDNPDFSRDHAEGRYGNARSVEAVQNIRESSITTLHARGIISGAQAHAGDRFRRLWEAMGGAGASAINYAQEPVDGGRAVDPIDPRQIDAGKELNRCRQHLGARGYDLICKVCGEGYSVKAVVGVASKRRDYDSAMDSLRAYLDDLCDLWNLRGGRS
ncbi:hypothetical protein C7T96_10205 [Nitratireductor sp. StC3]|nr:hypothetical protein C7T96_10205 [Nitratireductor sp. StC3]